MSSSQPAALPASHPAFEPVRGEYIDALNLEVQEFRHRATGATHYHLAAANTENVFLVALRTVPQDSTGVAHILEHTALCGSERYPVRDPFFMMLRRSINTFMNAFTSSDWTAYPFASQNRKDFDNLLDVYLDAVFFSRLDELDFAQEGHRVEFADPDNPESDLVFKGVVFNEMKGAMSSINSVLWDRICFHLFPSTTYHYNSGGDPAHIPDLSYEQLTGFYRTHYHPSNAIFMTFGDVSAEEHQAVFEDRALSRFEALDQRIEVPTEQRFDTPRRIVERYAFDEPGSSTDGRTHLVVAWIVGESTDLTELLEAQLLSSVLLDNSASPLLHALETTKLGAAPSPMCGLEDSMRELVFCCGIEGSEAEHETALEELVLGVIEHVAEEGIELSQLEAVLHQLELSQREISGDSYPYGLQLILTSLAAATHYSDPIALLDLEPVLAHLREQIKDPDYIRGIARRLLLDNPHRITLVVAPDTDLSEQRQTEERERLAAAKAAMDEAQQRATVQLAADLQARQAQVDDDSVLPRIELDDVPGATPELDANSDVSNGIKTSWYNQGTNGLVYRQLIAPLPELSADEIARLPLYSSALTELGLGDSNYLQVQQRQAAEVGAINAFNSMRGDLNDEQQLNGFFVLSSKALANRQEAQAQLMRDTLEHVRFDEIGRLRELVSQQRARREQSVTGNGHGLAMAAACAGMSPLAHLNHGLSGLDGLRAIKRLDESLRDDATAQAYGDQLAELHARITGGVQHLCVAEQEHMQSLLDTNERIWSGYGANDTPKRFSPAPVREQRRELWAANTQVNFCARAYATVPLGHDDAAALSVLGGFLRNGYLHRAIREQGGAYGGGAGQDSNIAAFRFYSYRDPRLDETLADFDTSIAWLLETQHDPRSLEEAILGVIGSLDKPSSPAGEAKQHFHNNLFGRSHAQREAFRQQVLEVSLDDLKRVTQLYLKPEQASTAVIAPAGSDAQAAADRLGLVLEQL